MSTVDLVKNQYLYFQDALEVLDETKDYSAQSPTRSTTIHRDFQFYYAMDCEMVWVDRGDPPYSPNDLRKTYPFKLEEFTCHVEKVNAGINKTGDEATNLIEFIDMKPPIPREAIKGEPNASAIRKTRDIFIQALKDELTRYVLTIARITIVDWDGYIFTDKFIKPKPGETVIWCPPSSGIPNNFYDLLNERITPPTIHINGKVVNVPDDIITFTDAKRMVNTLLTDPALRGARGQYAIMIGHNLLGSDYYAMGYDQIEIDQLKIKTRDTAYLFGYEEYYVKEKTFKINHLKMKNLVKGFLKKDIQKAVNHDPSEDARGALAIYKLFRDGIEDNTYENVTTPCPLYPKITNQYTSNKDPDGTKLLHTVIQDLLENLSISSSTLNTPFRTDTRRADIISRNYIRYIEYLLS